MKIQNKFAVLLVAISIFALSSFFVAHAQQTLPPQLLTPPSAPDPIEGSVNCFDYYHFGSVQVNIESQIVTAIPGVPLTLQGKIKNANDYPVVDGSVYIKVFKKLANDKDTQANGFQLVDQFTAKDNISLAANEEQNIDFTWNIPNYATSGDYQIATFFISAKKFNLLGLSFTNDVVGNTFNFSVKAQSQETVAFNKNTIKINDKDYNFAAFPPRIDKDAEATIKAQLTNSTKQTQFIPVTWTLYSWDGQQQENILDIKTETIQLKPNETKDLTYTTTNSTNPVSYLVVQANYKDTKSILDIRFVRSGVDKVRLNFPAITNYPLKANQPETLFSCLHNSGQSSQVDNNKLILTLIDENGKEIHKYNYAGAISSAMMGLKDEFTPTKNYDIFTLKAELYHDNQLVDSAEMKYDCKNIKGTVCQEKKTDLFTSLFNNDQGQMSLKTLVVIVVIVLLLVSLIIFAVMRRKRGGMNILILGLVVTGAVLFGNVGKSEAKSVISTLLIPGDIKHCDPESGCFAYSSISNVNVTMDYGMIVLDANNNPFTDGSNVPTGTNLKVYPQFYSTSWVGTGSFNDSPYGYETADASYPSSYPMCQESDRVGSQGGYSGYVYLSYAKSNTFSHTNNVSCGTLNASGYYDCTVNAVGEVAFTSRFHVDGKFWTDWSYPSNPLYQCYGHHPMADGEKNPGSWIYNEKNSGTFSASELDVTYNLSAVVPANSNPPTAPIITGPTNGSSNIDYTFTATSTDLDNDQLKYGFDWNNDNTVDQWMPGTGYVASGTTQSVTHQWIANGNYSFKVLAQDNQGTNSAWSSYTVAIMSGTLIPTFSSCVIPEGASTCTISLSWSISNPIGTPTAITASGMTNVNVTNTLATPQSGTVSSLVVPWGGRIFYLYNNSVSLAQSTVAASSVTCATGTSWNGINCATGAINGYYSDWGTCGANCLQTATNCVPPQNGGLACPTPAPTRSCTGGSCVASGACSSPAIHYTCGDGSDGSNKVNSPSKWTWTCGATSCSQRKSPGYIEN